MAQKLVEFVKKGGSAVLGGQFSNHISDNKFDILIKKFGLDWQYGSYFRSTFFTNASNELVQKNPSLPKSYSMKTLHVKNITPEMAVYVATEDSRLTSMVYDPVKVSEFSDERGACGVCAGGGRPAQFPGRCQRRNWLDACYIGHARYPGYASATGCADIDQHSTAAFNEYSASCINKHSTPGINEHSTSGIDKHCCTDCDDIYGYRVHAPARISRPRRGRNSSAPKKVHQAPKQRRRMCSLPKSPINSCCSSSWTARARSELRLQGS